MILSFVLFGAVFSSVVWLVYAIQFIASSLSGMSFFDAGIINVLLYSLFVCLPILIIWAIFGFVSQFVFNRLTTKQLFRLFSQMKKNQEYSDLLAKIMLETEQNIKNSFALGRFDLIIADMNELLSEFLQRERLASAEQIEHLWTKVQNGGKWSFGKVLIENYNLQPDFQKRIFNNAQEDSLLAGTIMEFCARYQTLLKLLEKHDKDRILLGIVETGVLGKVFAILAPLADEIQRTREIFVSAEKDITAENINPVKNENVLEHQKEEIAQSQIQTTQKKGEKFSRLWERFISQNQEPNSLNSPQKDPLSLALERSFGKNDTQIKEEPVFDTLKMNENSDELMVDKTDVKKEISSDNGLALDTQKTLDSLRKEWQSLNSNVQEDIADKPKNEKIVSPFSGWTDVENYQK